MFIYIDSYVSVVRIVYHFSFFSAGGFLLMVSTTKFSLEVQYCIVNWYT